MKLSKTQQEVLDRAKRDIDRVRNLDYPEWMKQRNWKYSNKDELNSAIEREEDKERWQAERNGLALTHCNSRTLWKLQEMGLIKIVKDSKGSFCGIDTIKVLNY